MVYNLGLIRIKGKATSESLLRLVTGRLNSFGLDLDDIICLQTDGCSTMKRLGRLVSNIVGHQLCYSHAVQLAILDTFYFKKSKENQLKENQSKENSDDWEYLSPQESEDEESSPDDDYDDLMIVTSIDGKKVTIKSKFEFMVNKVHKIVKIFNKPKSAEVLDDIVFSKFKKIIRLQK